MLKLKKLLLAGPPLFAVASALASNEAPIEWTALPPIPDQEGFAAPFAGTHEGKLIVAGGANFPDAKPWDGGIKTWYDKVFVLDQPDGAWREAGRLPRPLGYGVSLSVPEGVVCIGGSDAERHHADVFIMRLDGAGGPVFDPLPPLPKPCANMSGALAGRVIYVAGGIEKPDATAALHTVWTLDLDRAADGWREIEPWPGSGRMLAAAGALDGSFFLVGGAGLQADADGKPEREWLRDGYRFTPGSGWTRLTDAPQISVAAPSPMPFVAGRGLLLIGGDDGSQLAVAPEDHRGFPTGVFAYDPARDAWSRAGAIPLGLVTTPTTLWQSRVVVPGGEKKPGTRSTEVWTLPLPQPPP